MFDKQAILIIMHNNLWTLEKILKILDSKYFDIYIHIDKKSKIKIDDIKNLKIKKSQVFIYKNIDVRWADISQVECELFLLENAFNHAKYKYFHLISGVDMPLKKAEEIFNFFNNSDKEYIHYENEFINNDRYNLLNRYYILSKYQKNFFLSTINGLVVRLQILFKITRNLDRNYFKNGSQWFSITLKLSQYLLEKKEEILETYKYTLCSDEVFLHTLAYNSKFKENLYKQNFEISDSMRHIDWNRGKPYTFRLNDYDELINSNCMFARKFDENIDKEIIEKLYQTLKD